MFGRKSNKDKTAVSPDASEAQQESELEHNYAHQINRDPAHDASADLVDPDSGVKRGLKNRHLSMMALAGIIGPGLLIGAGGALANGGPASLLIGFGVIGE